MRVSILDRSPIFLHGASVVLAGAGYQVVGAHTRSVQPLCWSADVFVLDPVAVVDADPVDFVRQGARLCPILVLAGDAGIGFVAAGAAGVIDRDGASEVLVNAVADVTGQVGVISPRTSAESDTCPELSPREHEVLAQIADGLTHGQIARKLGISSHTVDTYVKRIRSKIGVGNKADLTRAALLGRF